jgi:Cu-Zn family superoxide dismutase
MKVRGIMVGLISLVLGTSASWAVTGMADIHGTAEGSPIKGTAHLEDTASGLHVQAQLVNVPAGAHGFHIHEFGSCDGLGKAAGGHYNPLTTPHGQVLKEGIHHAHAGDMGNITAEANGNASIDVTIPGVTLSGGKFDVAGRAIILHEKADDFSQPTGNAGGRIGCGTILIVPDQGMSAPK